MKKGKKTNHFGEWARRPTLHPHRRLLFPPVPYGPPRCVSVVVVAVPLCHGRAVVVGDDSDRLWMW